MAKRLLKRPKPPYIKYYTYQVCMVENYTKYMGTCIEFPMLNCINTSDIKALVGVKQLVKCIIGGRV